jgi:hypothetical protein
MHHSSKLARLPKHSKHILRISIFIVAAIVIFVLRRHGYTSGFVGISTELVMSTIVDRLFPGGSFLGDIEQNT